MLTKKGLLFVSLLVMVLGFGIATKVYKNSESDRLEAVAAQNSSVFIREYSPRLGNAQAKVKLVEYLDPECESCRRFYPVVKEIMKDFDGKVELIVRYVPFHKNSKFAIKILEASRKQNKFWETLEAIFYFQPHWGNHQNPKPELLWEILPKLGLDVEQIKKDMNDPEILKRIDQDMADAQNLNVRQTPSFFVNTSPLKEFGVEQLRNLVKSEIAKVQ